MKKGFTLIELLAVIILIGVLMVFLVPNALETFGSNKNQLTRIQKDQIKESVDLYLNDYCINPISDCYQCPFETEYNELEDKIVIKYNQSNSISLNELVESENACNEKTSYIDKSIISNCDKTKSIKFTSNGEIDLSEITCNFDRK